MAATEFSGPVIGFGQAPSLDANPNIGPGIHVQGYGMMDPRPYYQVKGQSNSNAFFAATSTLMTLNITPAAKATGAVAAAANAASGAAMTLVSASGSGIVVGASVVNPLTGVSVASLLAVGQAAALVGFGSSGKYKAWDPNTLTARALSITCNSASGTGGAFTVSGYDVYGFPMHETLTSAPASALVVTGKKAWKYIASVTPAFTDATYTYSVDTTDIFGLPLASNYFGDAMVNYPAAVVTANTGYTAGVNTLASATTGDVRGTYALQSASNGTNRLIVYQTPPLANLQIPNGVAGTNTGVFGVAQY